MKTSLPLTFFLCLLASTSSYARHFNLHANISSSTAHQLSRIGAEECLKDGYQVAVTVVNASGGVVSIYRTDMASNSAVKSSEMKAFTAVSTRNLTGNVMKDSQKNTAITNLRDIPGFLILGGGVPIKMSGEVIGAIGVGGTPDGKLDEKCAIEAINKLGVKELSYQ